MSDLIDRQELLKHKGNCYDEEGHLLYAVGTGTILLMPTVDAEPVKHGHWIRNDNGTYSCSECYSWIPDEQHYYARYCLFCGAKMDEEEK